MPHMSNLPWLSTYWLLFMMVIMMIVSFSFPSRTNNLAKKEETLTHTKILNKWLW